MIYDKIKEICKKKGISVASVEKEAGLANGAISKWNECNPTAEKLYAVSKAIGVSIEYFLEE